MSTHHSIVKQASPTFFTKSGSGIARFADGYYGIIDEAGQVRAHCLQMPAVCQPYQGNKFQLSMTSFNPLGLRAPGCAHMVHVLTIWVHL